MFLFAQLFALMALSHCTYDVGALSRLNVETLKRAPIPSLADLYVTLPREVIPAERSLHSHSNSVPPVDHQLYINKITLHPKCEKGIHVMTIMNVNLIDSPECNRYLT